MFACLGLIKYEMMMIDANDASEKMHKLNAKECHLLEAYPLSFVDLI